MCIYIVYYVYFNNFQLQDLIFSHLTQQKKTAGGFNPRSAMFVCNKWEQIPSAEREQVKDYVMVKLHETWPGFKEDQVFFISAKRVSTVTKYTMLYSDENHTHEMLPLSHPQKYQGPYTVQRAPRHMSIDSVVTG